MVSKDGGKTFARGFGGGDNHDMYIDPTKPGRIAVAHDNGVIFTADSGKTSVRSTTPTGQYYVVSRATCRRIRPTPTSCMARTMAEAWTC